MHVVVPFSCTVGEALQLAVVAAVTVVGVLRQLHLHRMACTDELTGVANRRGLLQAYRKRIRRRGARPAVILLDLVGFKAVNDSYGHDIGDEVLVQVAARLESVAQRFGGVAGRLGGDEFALLLPGLRRAGLHDAVRAVEQSLVTPVRLSGAPTHQLVRVVIGAALPSPDTAPDRPFREADIALYTARHQQQPHAIYTTGMRHPQAAVRQGSRLREQRPSTPATAIADELRSHAVQPAQQALAAEVARLRRTIERIAEGAEDMFYFPGMAGVAEAARAVLAGEDIATQPYVSRFADDLNDQQVGDDECE